jgi:Flp pilus assembly protein TadG
MMSGLRRQAQELLDRLRRETHGAIALQFALFVPVLAIVSLGAIDLMAVTTAKSRLQDIADAAALAGAPSLALATDGAAARERSAAFVAGQLSQWSDAPTVVETYQVVTEGGQRGIRVLLQANRQSFFVNMLPPGGWNFVGDATATTVGQTPLCVLATGSSGAVIDLAGNTAISAPDCGVHANATITVKGAASLKGRKIQASKEASGNMDPIPGERAPSVTDPFASMKFPSLDGCLKYPPEKTKGIILEDSQTHYLEPGIHCGPITVKNKTILVLLPGDHFFRKNLALQGHGRLTGEDVFVFFDHGSDPLFSGMYATVNLIGRKSGSYAGMVMATIAGNQPDIILPGKNVERLLGVVYIRHPNGSLKVSGSGAAAEDSAWTVIVATKIISSADATIRINADYESSDVPVPNGVGPNGGGLGGGGTRLVY